MISIHALLAESDLPAEDMLIGADVFLSTLSLRRATGEPMDGPDLGAISIHALLAESDLCWLSLPSAVRFLSTLSLRRATARREALSGRFFISIHALLAESDCQGHSQALPGAISIHALLAESDGAG